MTWTYKGVRRRADGTEVQFSHTVPSWYDEVMEWGAGIVLLAIVWVAWVFVAPVFWVFHKITGYPKGWTYHVPTEPEVPTPAASGPYYASHLYFRLNHPQLTFWGQFLNGRSVWDVNCRETGRVVATCLDSMAANYICKSLCDGKGLTDVDGPYRHVPCEPQVRASADLANTLPGRWTTNVVMDGQIVCNCADPEYARRIVNIYNQDHHNWENRHATEN